jgi:hypothetical protein
MTISAEKLVKQLNYKLTGWANYFHLGPVSKAYLVVDAHTNYRLRQWLCKKHRVNGKGISRFPGLESAVIGVRVRFSSLVHHLKPGPSAAPDACPGAGRD